MTVAQKLVSEFFLRFSLSERLHSDQGRNFESTVILEVCKCKTTLYHPQCDGLVECFNRTLLDMLAKVVHEQPFQLCFAYNSSVNPTTGFSPFYLMFGRRARLPIDLAYCNPDTPNTTLPQYVAGLCSSLEAVYDKVRKTKLGDLVSTALLYARENPESYTAHGQDHSKSSEDSLMLYVYITFSMFKPHASNS